MHDTATHDTKGQYFWVWAALLVLTAIEVVLGYRQVECGGGCDDHRDMLRVRGAHAGRPRPARWWAPSWVGRAGLQRFEDCSILGHERCADELSRRFGLDLANVRLRHVVGAKKNITHRFSGPGGHNGAHHGRKWYHRGATDTALIKG